MLLVKCFRCNGGGSAADAAAVMVTKAHFCIWLSNLETIVYYLLHHACLVVLLLLLCAVVNTVVVIWYTYYYFFKQLSISHVFRQLTYLLFHPQDDCFDADISTNIHNDNLPMRTDVYYLVFDFLIHKHMPYLPPVLITYSVCFLHNYLCRPFF